MNDPQPAPSRTSSHDRLAEDRGSPLVYRSSELFAGSNEVLIEHDGVTYRLLITRHGKLLLNK